MSSGFGIRGNVGRCYPFYKAYESCLSTADKISECSEIREDYFECCHHKKEFTRIETIRSEAARQASAKDGGGGGHH
jgi:NADH dehydrogenase (ubiquinone) Fe-S protein 5